MLPDFAAMSKKQLEEEAAKAGISLFPSKADSIKWLDELEPGVNHAGMSGQVLIAKKQQFGLGKVKTKEQLATELKAKFKPAAAEKAKQAKALKEVTDAKATLSTILAETKTPTGPEDVASYHQQIEAMQDHLAKYQGILPDANY